MSNQVVQTALLPADARSLGQPLYCRIAHADMTTITEIWPSTWAAGEAPLNEAAAAAGSGTHVGIIPRALTQEPLTWWSGEEA
jgi:hypothetical protein